MTYTTFPVKSQINEKFACLCLDTLLEVIAINQSSNIPLNVTQSNTVIVGYDAPKVWESLGPKQGLV